MSGATHTPRATLRDVAAESQVSPATVSFVLNETPGQTISAETRERVHTAARRLGYTPHRIARALREGASRTVLLSTVGLPRGHSLESFILGLDTELRSLGHILFVTHSHGGMSLPAEAIDAIAPRAVLDLSAVYNEEADPGWEGGWIDGLAAHGFAQIQYLAENGHRDIAIAVPRGSADTRIAGLRVEHACEAALALGLPKPVIVQFDQDRDTTAREISVMRQRHPRLTAWAAFDDDTALIVLGALAELNVSVPADTAVIGFDEGLHGSLWRPSLTTVHIDAEAYGRRAARAVLGLPPGAEQPAPSRIVRRESA